MLSCFAVLRRSELWATLCGYQSIDGHVAGFEVHLQIEAIGEERLLHKETLLACFGWRHLLHRREREHRESLAWIS